MGCKEILQEIGEYDCQLKEISEELVCKSRRIYERKAYSMKSWDYLFGKLTNPEEEKVARGMVDENRYMVELTREAQELGEKISKKFSELPCFKMLKMLKQK